MEKNMRKRAFSFLVCLLILNLVACRDQDDRLFPTPTLTSTSEGPFYRFTWRGAERDALLPEGISQAAQEQLSTGNVGYLLIGLDTKEDRRTLRKRLQEQGIGIVTFALGPNDATFFATVLPSASEALNEMDSEGTLLFAALMPPEIKLDSDLVERVKSDPFGTSNIYIELFAPPNETQKKELDTFLKKPEFPIHPSSTMVGGHIMNRNLHKLAELPYVMDIGPSGGQLLPTK